MRCLLPIALLACAGCTEPSNTRYPSTLVVTSGVGRWCADGRVYGDRPFGDRQMYGFRDHATGQWVVVSKAETVLSVRPDSSCTP